jgi:kynurenine formamidase
LGKEKYLVENAAHLDDLPAQGSWILVLPMKIKDATEAPIRLIALVE